MRIAIITGASSGIGREFALIASEKYKFDCMWLIARREDRLKETALFIGTDTRIFPLDLSLDLSLKVLEDVLKKEKPVVHLLVNAAGFGKFGTVESQYTDDVKNMIDVNVRALTVLTKLCLPYMSPNGAIINMASASGFLPLPCMNVYAATKAYVIDFSRALAEEIRNSGVSVTAVCPYWVSSEFIPVAKKTPQGECINNFLFMTYPFDVAKKALEDSDNGFDMSFPGCIPVVIKMLSRVLPESLQMAVWNRIRYLRIFRYNQQFPEQLPLQ